jgi:hypothetical protein
MIDQPNPQPPVTSTTTILLLHCCNNAMKTHHSSVVVVVLLLVLLFLLPLSVPAAPRLQKLCNNKRHKEQPAAATTATHTHQTRRDKRILGTQQQSVHIRYTDAQTKVAERRGLRQAAAFWLLLAPVSIAVNW